MKDTIISDHLLAEWVSPTIVMAAALACFIGMGIMWIWRTKRVYAMEQENALLRQKLETAERAQGAMKDQFRLMSTQAIAENSETLKKTNEERMQSIVAPLKQLLEQLKTEVSNARESHIKTTSGLNGRIEEMLKQTQRIGNDAVELAKALKGDSKKRGNWGELVLETLLSGSGLREGEQYVLQPSYNTEEGRFQPDAVIKFPDNRSLVVDSKVSLVDYERYVNSEDVKEQEAALKAHKESMKRHMKSLTSKAYSRLMEGETLDYVIMFVPIEAAYIAAFHDGSNDLLLEGCKNKVLIVSPTNLIMTLKIALHLWNKQQQLDGVKNIVDLATAIYDKCATLSNRFDKLENGIRKVADAYVDMRKCFSDGRGSLMAKVIEMKEKGGLETKEDMARPVPKESSLLPDAFSPGSYLPPDA